MNAVILYDEFELAAKAHGVLARAAQRAHAAVPWSISPWRLDLLMLPPIAEGSLKDSSAAHLIVLAIRNQAELPPWLWKWLEQWALHRHVPDAALAVFDSTAAGDALSNTAASTLSQFAERYGLSFIFGDASPAGDESASLLGELHPRAVAQTPALPHVLKESPRDRHRRWALESEASEDA